MGMIKTSDLGKSFNRVISQFYEAYSFYSGKSNPSENSLVFDRAFKQLSLKEMRAKSKIIQSGSYFHICGLKNKEKKDPALFRGALEKEGFIVVEMAGTIGTIEVDDFY